MDKINPKVTAATAGGAFGGAGLAVFTIWFLQDGLGIAADKITPERVIAITSAWGALCSFASGWLKKHGIEIEPPSGDGK